MFLLAVAAYVLIGVVAMLIYRWHDEGFEILLDVLLWPLMVYYWIKYRKGL